jgi:NADPH-dependent glutamate synthase beta subunit-like oxidoreductase
MADNPLPAVMGRACYRPCETACNRAQMDSAVGINSVERFLGDEAIRAGWTVPPAAESTGKRVLIVGAGPAGLSAGYQLTRMGHQVTIADSGPRPGGMMRFGIPAYRLPRAVIDAEIGRILDMGVTLRPGHTVTDIRAEMRDGAFDAAFLAVGAQVGKRAYIRRATPPGSWTRFPYCTRSRKGNRRCSAGGSRCTAAAIPPSTRRGPPGGWARPTRSSSTGAPGNGCRPTTSRSRRPRRKASG